MSQTKATDSNEELKVTVELLLNDALVAKKASLTKEEKEALLRKVMKRDSRGFVRHRGARQMREAKKLQQERAAKIASSLALTVGGTAAGGMLVALALPSATALTVVGAVAGMVSGALSAWMSAHPREKEKKQEKESA
ncbi:hypothetical protein P0Y43_16470 [Pseudomonas entomophila]|uniref:hypothetical protein n=1 Tax=Pseudomonas entomophila TaxID=312306 RepID=UPI0023D88D48|nr:hypothetical protein [Pseudomonas entomophila]MDF0732307.1 hypothetical protein [Pseudomonas entomophila]